MPYRLYFLSVSFLLPWLLAAQSGWQQREVLPIAAERVWPLPSGGWLALDRAGTLRSYDATGRQTAYLWSDRRLGAPDAVDASQPLRIALFFRDWQQVLWLDRTLTVVGSLSFAEAGWTEVAAVATAPDRGLWCYLPWQRRLVWVADDGRLLREGPPLDLVLAEVPDSVRWLQRHERRLYLAATEAVFVFDDFGQYVGKIGLPQGAADVQLAGAWLICRKAEALWWQHLHDPFRTRTLPLPPVPAIRQTWWKEGRLFVLSQKGLEVWQPSGG